MHTLQEEAHIGKKKKWLYESVQAYPVRGMF